MLTVLVDYDSGNLHSAEKAFQRMAAETGARRGPRHLAARGCRARRPHRAARRRRLSRLPQRRWRGYSGLFEAIEEAVTSRARPFLGICVGMQMMATWGREYRRRPGLWLDRRRGGADRPRRPRAESAAYGLERSGHRPCPPGPGRDRDRRSRLFRPFLPLPRGRPGASAWPMSIMPARSPPSSGATPWSAPSSTRKKARRPGCA